MKTSKKITNLLLVSLLYSPLYWSTPVYAKSLSKQHLFLSQSPSNEILTLNTPVEKQLNGNESHNYSIAVTANNYLKLAVEQKGIDVVVRLFSSSGEKLAEVDSPNGNQGEEPLEAVLENEGIYRVEIASLEKEAKPGKYQVSIKEQRPSTDKDKALIKANSFDSQIVTLREKSKLDQALPLAIEALEIRKTILGAQDFKTIASLVNLALLYRLKGEYSKAEPLCIELVETNKKTFGENHPNTITAINNLGELYRLKGEYERAEPLYLQALEAFKKTLGINHPLTVTSINTLGGFYRDKGEYSKAEALSIQAVEIRKKILGENHPSTALSINNLALVYRLKGEYDKAETLYLQSLEIRKKALGENHLDVSQSLNNLAIIYQIKGEYDKAEPFYIQAINICKKTLGESHPNTADFINNLAALYVNKGNYDKAETLYLQILETFKKVLGENHPSTAQALNNLATLYNEKGDYAKAEPLLIQALEIRKKTLGNNHPATAASINNLALLYQDKKEYEKSEPLYFQAAEIRKKVLGENHPDTAQSINNLAFLYQSKGEYEKAETLYLQALDINKKALGDYHPNNTLFLNNLARFYLIRKDYPKATKYNIAANEIREKELSRNLTIGSEKSKQLYLQKYESEKDITLSLHIQNQPNNPLALESAITQVFRRKGRTIDVANQSIEALRKRSNPEDIALLDKLSDKKSQHSNLVLGGLGKLSAEERQNKIKSLEGEIEELESQISQKSVEFSVQNQPITLQTIKQSIPQNAVLAEFASYRPYDIAAKSFSPSNYVVYLLDNRGTLKWANLGETKVIDELIDQLREKLRNKHTSVNEEIKPLARELDKLIMQPVRALIPKGKRLLIAPDGKLSLIPFETLVDQRGRFLVENYSISYLTSGRDLLRLKTKIESHQEPILIGNPDFGKIVSTSVVQQNATRTVFSDLYFPTLRATELEARPIKQLLPNAQLLLKKDATEEALNSVNAPSILHIATHGFFLKETVSSIPNTTDEESEQTRIARRKDLSNVTPLTKIENPLLRSGIALTGANLHQTGENIGIFTALKATSLNLWGTKIVVLSACDTGVGEVKTGDGVYGLRRALVLAGSETQMMSLWPVSDSGTKDLMISYYSKLKNGMGRGDALRQTQLELLRSPKYQHPFYWASFVQSGQWSKIDNLH